MSYSPRLHYKRDRHGRGLRGPLLNPRMPLWRSRAQAFDELVVMCVRDLTLHLPAVADIEFGVEDVPPSDPAPWERRALMCGRYFPASHTHACRIVVYRMPIQTRSFDQEELVEMLRDVMVETVAAALALTPDQVRPPAWKEK